MRSPCIGFLAALAVSAAVTGVGAAPASALTDQIAYRCDLDICTVSPDPPGTVTNVTFNGASSLDARPAWSPDGTKIAFMSTFPNASGAWNIFVMQPDLPGTSVNVATQVTFYTAAGNINVNEAPVWSRDGTRIAFERQGIGVFAVPADGTTDPVQVGGAGGEHPSWSPDGGRIAYSKGEQVYLADANGGGTPTPLADGAGHDPVWSPDGTRIAFDVINATDPFVDLHVVRVDGGGTPVITPITYSQWTFAAWSPEGTKIAYRSTNTNDGAMRVVNADGTQDLGLASAPQQNNYAPTWSPDGARVAFQGYRYGNPLALTNEIYVASTSDGSGTPRAVTTGGKNHEPAWRPDPARSPFVPILTPAAPGGQPPGPAAPTPGPPRPPKLVWFTKRVVLSPGSLFRPFPVAVYTCTAPSCSVSASSITRSSAPPSGASVSAKKRSRTIALARGRMVVPGGASRSLKLKLTRAGAALLRQRRNLTITVNVATSSTGRATVRETRRVRLRYVGPRKRGR